ncbi:hypothetical protein IU453_28190 [Nocardia cyriacigeorgica]|uniref:hypothetical protein n=1 Tax=Nocardia cyriacigeorgica TaxID=135487 RepID=UPI001894A990|nr:hypothetical protein [Nocardia cyriacigeorgica]MBF6320628.1 hypothetical protein [Nocardia cyriacigeorgica]MBF6347263.1 hypothetical protein [Nocardia cyriacigeorgica]
MSTRMPSTQSPRPLRRARDRSRRAGLALRDTVRQIAGGVDAFSRVRHGLPVPPGHPARNDRTATGRRATG